MLPSPALTGRRRRGPAAARTVRAPGLGAGRSGGGAPGVRSGGGGVARGAGRGGGRRRRRGARGAAAGSGPVARGAETATGGRGGSGRGGRGPGARIRSTDGRTMTTKATTAAAETNTTDAETTLVKNSYCMTPPIVKGSVFSKEYSVNQSLSQGRCGTSENTLQQPCHPFIIVDVFLFELRRRTVRRGCNLVANAQLVIILRRFVSGHCLLEILSI